MSKNERELNYCRRCAATLHKVKGHKYQCAQGHTIYDDSSPAVSLLLTNTREELLVLTRARDPGKGKLDLPGGFCDKEETLDDSLHREVLEETSIRPEQYSAIEFISSTIDHYLYEEETNPVATTVFKAKLLDSTVLPTAGDDAATANFIPINSIDAKSFFFPSAREAFNKL